MKIEVLRNKIEKIAAKVHDAWWGEKKKQGFHSPMDCDGEGSKVKFVEKCSNCHKDMYPYGDLPGHVQEYDRVTVRIVLKAIESIEGDLL